MARRLRLLTVAPLAVREGIAIALGDEVDLCAQVGSAAEAIRAAMRERPDVCVIARELSGDGLAAVRGICRAAPQTSVLVLADGNDPRDLLDAVRAGAIGYVPDVTAESLRRIVPAIHAKEAVVPRAMVLELLRELRMGVGVDGLSAREAQVLGLLRRGSSTGEIAVQLRIAPVTVRRHISGLVRKLGVSDRAELISS